MKRLGPAICAIGVLLASPVAQAKEKITFGYLLSPIYESFIYPIKAGIIKSDTIEVVGTPLSVAASIQATATKQFDVVTTSAFAVPTAYSKGLEVKIMSTAIRYRKDGLGANLWVKNDSPFKSVKDLKGKTIGVSSFNASNATLTRIAIKNVYGMDVKFDGGDFQWVQMPESSAPAALQTGKIDASNMLHTQALLAINSKTFRELMNPIADLYKKYQVEAVTAVQVSYPERLAEKPEAYREFNRMLKASVDYTMSHIDEVSKAVAKGKLEESFLKDWLEHVGSFPGAVSDGDIKALEVTWKSAKDLGIIPSYPDADKVVWEHAVRTR